MDTQRAKLAEFLKSRTMYTETKWRGGWGSGVGMGSEGLLMLNVNSIKFCSPHEHFKGSLTSHNFFGY